MSSKVFLVLTAQSSDQKSTKVGTSAAAPLRGRTESWRVEKVIPFGCRGRPRRLNTYIVEIHRVAIDNRPTKVPLPALL